MSTVVCDAVVSECGAYRYRLRRHWGGGPRLAFIMLNPSKADASADDPTIRKCMGFARRLGFDGIEVGNLFAYRATDPNDLKRAGFPVGPDNDQHLRAMLLFHPNVVCAWGSNAAGHPRVSEVLRLLDEHPAVPTPLALRVNRDGTPAHPLMLPYRSELVRYRATT